jgi:hypothetical protein
MSSGLRLLPAALTASIMLSCSAAAPSTAGGHRYALIYGVTRYLGGNADPIAADTVNFPAGASPNLSYPGADAASVADMVRQDGYDKVVSRIIDKKGDVILDGVPGAPGDAPTRTALSEDVQRVAALAGPSDTFLFYYSGHGTQDSSGSDEYIIPYGAVQSAGKSFTISQSDLVSQSDLAGLLAPIHATRKVVVLDSCNSGGFIGNMLEKDRTPSAIGVNPVASPLSSQVISEAIRNYQSFMSGAAAGISPYDHALVISACGKDELSYEDSALGHGVMTYFLLQAPVKGDLNGDGVVTALEAFSLVKAGIEESWNRDAAVIADRAQFEPHVSGGPVDFVLFSTSPTFP